MSLGPASVPVSLPDSLPDAGRSAAADAAPVSVAEFVGRAVAAFGATHAFGVVGSGNFALTNALRSRGVEFVAARHEGGAIVMADAFARMAPAGAPGTDAGAGLGAGAFAALGAAPASSSRRAVGVVTVHQGCGLTNTATGLGEAAKSRTPLLVLAAAAPAADPFNNFAMDQDGFGTSVGADAVTLARAEDAAATVHRTYSLALAGRAVLLNLPIDVLAASVSEADARLLLGWEAAGSADAVDADTAVTAAAAGVASSSPGAGPATPGADLAALPSAPAPVVPENAAIQALARILGGAERPVIIAGRGARSAGAALRELGAEAGALLATSAVAKGLFGRDAYSLGISGGFATPLAAELIRGADVVVAFGCALNDWTTRRGTLLAPNATLVQVDADPEALGRHRPVSLGVVGDAALVAEALTDTLEFARSGLEGEPGGRYRSNEVAARIASEGTWNLTPTPDLGGDGLVDPRVLTDAINDALPRQRVVSTDSGNFMGYPAQYLDVPDANGFCFTQAFQSIGLGLGTAIGAALAQPERLPVLGTGDGGFLMGISELETAVRLRMPLLVVVYNDSAYGAEVHHFGPADPGVDLGAVTFPETDVAAVARGFGAQGAVVRSAADVRVVQEWLDGVEAGERVPLVLDARIASDGGAWWLQGAFARH